MSLKTEADQGLGANDLLGGAFAERVRDTEIEVEKDEKQTHLTGLHNLCRDVARCCPSDSLPYDSLQEAKEKCL